MCKTRSRFSSVLRRKPKVGSHPDPILCPTSPLICRPIISPTFSLWIFASEQHEIFCINHLGHVNCATRVGYSHKLRPLFIFYLGEHLTQCGVSGPGSVVCKVHIQSSCNVSAQPKLQFCYRKTAVCCSPTQSMQNASANICNLKKGYLHYLLHIIHFSLSKLLTELSKRGFAPQHKKCCLMIVVSTYYR